MNATCSAPPMGKPQPEKTEPTKSPKVAERCALVVSRLLMIRLNRSAFTSSCIQETNKSVDVQAGAVRTSSTRSSRLSSST